MKKLIISLLCIGLLTNWISAISIVDIWRCRPSSPDAGCSKARRQEAEAWFANAKIDALKTLAADLAALGTRVTVIQLQKEQEGLTTEPTSSVTQQSEQFKEIQKRMEEMQRQRQKVMEQVAG